MTQAKIEISDKDNIVPNPEILYKSMVFRMEKAFTTPLLYYFLERVLNDKITDRDLSDSIL